MFIWRSGTITAWSHHGRGIPTRFMMHRGAGDPVDLRAHWRGSPRH
jgi:hypothetical protein